MPLPDLASLLKLSDTAAQKLAKLYIRTPWDLALHLPLRYEDETHLTPLADVAIGQSALVEGEVLVQEIQFKPRRQLVVQIADARGKRLILRFLHFYPSQQKQLAQGEKVRAYGEVRQGYYGLEMVHPKISPARAQALAEHLTPVYPTVSGLTQPTLRRWMAQVLKALATHPEGADTLPESLRQRLNLPELLPALTLLHHPTPDISAAQLQEHALPAWQRLKFDELLAQQLSMRRARRRREEETTAAVVGSGCLRQALLANLPFALTAAQSRVLSEIDADLARPHPMYRLLQGDVGSGKTIVAALTALTAVEAGFQVAVMAPTEILAEQHFAKFAAWCTPLGVAVTWLSGSLNAAARREALAALEDGSARIAVGTHALFQDKVAFAHLGLVIVDEQHRFGVAQRLALQHKGDAVHRLMMSATPIPRTLAMSFLADLDVSVIDELPPGRTPVKTRLVNNRRRSEVEAFVLHTCQQGQQAYWVCPLIEESEALQLQTATDTLARLQAALPGLAIGLVHGKLKAQEKAAVMAEFAAGTLQVLVATTVIEVGVDVPNAALMVIEHAERMGLSQLHQLRGRVGRGSARSDCILLFAEPLSDTARARLKIIYQHQDGFEIARQDLALRGPGELLGARQSGMPLLRFADLSEDGALLETARQSAAALLEEDPAAADRHLERWLSGNSGFLGA